MVDPRLELGERFGSCRLRTGRQLHRDRADLPSAVRAWRTLLPGVPCSDRFGYNTKKEGGVYDFCARYKEFIPSKGAATNQGLVRPLQETPIEHRGVTLLLKRYSSDLYAEELFHRRIKERVFEKGWWLPRDLCGQYVEHLSNERLEEDKNGKLRWVAKGPNHLAETEKMQCVWFDLLMYAGGEFPKGDKQ